MYCSEMVGIQRRLLKKIDNETERLLVCIAATFVFGLLAHAYGFLNLTISDDSLYEFTLSVSTAWKLKLGRFMQPLLRFFMGEIITLPWVTGITGLMFVSLAVHLMSKMFRLDHVWENIVLSGICVTNVTVTVVIATFIHDFCGDMCSLFLAVYAAYTYSLLKIDFSWKKMMLGSIALAGSLGFYQTYLGVTISLIIIDTIIDLFNGTPCKTSLFSILKAISMGICAVLLYLFCMYVSMHLFEATFTTGYKFRQSFNLNDLTIPYKYVIKDLFVPHLGDGSFPYGTQAVFLNIQILVCISNTVLFGLSVYSGISLVRKSTKRRSIFFTLVLIVLLPPSMLCMSLITGLYHEVMMYTVCLYYLVVLVFLNREQPTSMKAKRKLIPFFLMLAIIISNIQMANVAYVKKHVEREATLSKITRVLSYLDQYEGDNHAVSSVAIIGWETDMPFMDVGEIDEWIGIRNPYYASQITYRESLVKYLQTILNVHLTLCPVEEEIELSRTPEFKDMKVFPQKGCISSINGVTVIKMTDKPLEGYYGSRYLERQ